MHHFDRLAVIVVSSDKINFKGEMIEDASRNCFEQRNLEKLVKYIVAGIKDTQGQYPKRDETRM